jgi:hypothetical protein
MTSLTKKLADVSEVVCSTIEEILEEASIFHASLYAKTLSVNKDGDIVKHLKKHSERKLSKSQKDLCDRILTVDESKLALKKLPSGKAPGFDGLPAEFLRFFWEELKFDFHDVLIESFDSGLLPETMKSSVVTLIYKKKSRQDIRNYCPISLLCTDYKIYC